MSRRVLVDQVTFVSLFLRVMYCDGKHIFRSTQPNINDSTVRQRSGSVGLNFRALKLTGAATAPPNEN
jgi:hypothetical protein